MKILLPVAFAVMSCSKPLETKVQFGSVQVSPTSGLITTESGGTAMFSVVLGVQPSATVTIGLRSSNTSYGTIDKSTLTFTTGNWSVPQFVTITGIDDGAVAGGSHAYSIIIDPTQSSDANYDALNPADVMVTNADNDLAGVTISPTTGLTTKEAAGAGHTATFTLVLNVAPTGSVTVNLSSSDTLEGTVSPASVNFTSGNWSSPQTVTMTGVPDNKVDGNKNYTIITAPIAVTGTNYDGINAADVTLTNLDSDTANFTISPLAGLTTSETGVSATFTVQLTSQPTANVQISLSSDDTAEGRLHQTGGNCDSLAGTAATACLLTFTNANWNTPQTVKVTGMDEVATDGNRVYHIITAAATSTDTNFNGVDPSDVTLTNNDNDVPGITVSPTAGLTTTEAGGATTFQVVLNTAPASNVTLTLQSSNEAEGRIRRGANCDNAGAVGTGTCQIVFTPGNYNVPQTVGVVGRDDDVADGAISYSVFFSTPSSSGDANYNNLTPASVSISNTDNDTAGFTVSAISGPTSEAPGSATFTMRLNSQPTASVTVNLASSNNGEGTVSPASFTFTTGNWGSNQTATVTGVADNKLDGNIVYSIVTAAATSSDSVYNTMNPADVAVTNNNTDAGKYIFVTTNVTNGNIGTLTGADSNCNSDPAKPNAGTYAAVIGSVDNTGAIQRHALNFWILMTNQKYYRGVDGLLVGTTDSFGIFGSINISFHNAAAAYWTGLDDAYRADTLAVFCQFSGTVNAWTNSLATRSGTVGDGLSTSSTSINNGTAICSTTNRLLCAEQ